MPEYLEFVRGPLFRFAFLIMVLGLLRHVITALWGIGRMVYRARDTKNDYVGILRNTFIWLIPLTRLHKKLPVTGISSYIFHIGIILVPLFLVDHINLWRSSLGIGWPGIPKIIADLLCYGVFVSGTILLGIRIFNVTSRSVSRFMDYFLLILIQLIFVTGFLASRPYNPIPYNIMMFVHILSADVLFLLMPFSKIAHCVLFPFVRMTSELAWKFPPYAGRDATIQVHGEVKSI